MLYHSSLNWGLRFINCIRIRCFTGSEFCIEYDLQAPMEQVNKISLVKLPCRLQNQNCTGIFNYSRVYWSLDKKGSKMDTIEIKYKDKLVMLLNSDCEPVKIECRLPLIDEGNNRIVYDLGDKILKVAKTSVASIYNWNEYKLWNFLKERSKKIKINEIFEIDENGYWYVAEKIEVGDNDAMEKALQYIWWLDYAANAGYDKNGKLTIVDAENIYVEDLEYLLRKGTI